MKILWTVNNLMPEVAKQMGMKATHAISWVDAMSRRLRLRENVSLAIASPGAVKVICEKKIDGITYFVFPVDGNDYWGKIIDSFEPDIIHAYGTEHKHNLNLLRNHKEIPIVVSLQGILSEYQYHYYAGIDFTEMLKYISIKSIFLKDGFFSGRADFKKRAKIEREILKETKYVEGRSTWDRVSALNINPNLQYYYCPRLIRSSFYSAKWDVNKMEPYSIFVHQGNYPIKGLHFVFKALEKLKKKYPNVKLYIAGNAYFNPQNIKQRVLQNGYLKYLNKLMKSLGISDNIFFTGYLSSEELAKKLERVNVVVIPSSIENAPNSLAEAELVGTPCIASFVGGNMDMLEHGKDGFLYCYNEPNMLTEYISRIFDSKELAMQFSNHGRDTANKRHNPDELEITLMEIYRDIISKEAKK